MLNFKGHAWNFIQSFKPIHCKICIVLIYFCGCFTISLNCVIINLSKTGPREDGWFGLIGGHQPANCTRGTLGRRLPIGSVTKTATTKMATLVWPKRSHKHRVLLIQRQYLSIDKGLIWMQYRRIAGSCFICILKMYLMQFQAASTQHKVINIYLYTKDEWILWNIWPNSRFQEILLLAIKVVYSWKIVMVIWRKFMVYI